MSDFDLGDQRNTWQQGLAPEPAPAYDELDDLATGAFGLRPVISGKLFARVVCYAVIVEMWEKRKYGRVRRAWEAEFTQAERNKLARYHGRFFRWHLVSGPPRRIALQLNTLHLLQRAAAFFARV